MPATNAGDDFVAGFMAVALGLIFVGGLVGWIFGWSDPAAPTGAVSLEEKLNAAKARLAEKANATLAAADSLVRKPSLREREASALATVAKQEEIQAKLAAQRVAEAEARDRALEQGNGQTAAAAAPAAAPRNDDARYAPVSGAPEAKDEEAMSVAGLTSMDSVTSEVRKSPERDLSAAVGRAGGGGGGSRSSSGGSDGGGQSGKVIGARSRGGGTGGSSKTGTPSSSRPASRQSSRPSSRPPSRPTSKAKARPSSGGGDANL